jgi:hypothetical protein
VSGNVLNTDLGKKRYSVGSIKYLVLTYVLLYPNWDSSIIKHRFCLLFKMN